MPPRNKKNNNKVLMRKMTNTVADIARIGIGAAKKAKKKANKPAVKPGGVLLSECGLKFASAIADPWSISAAGACIPTVPSRPSQKVTMFSRGVMTIGTNGVGFVLLAPCLANNLNSIYYSNASFTGTTANFTNSGTNVISTVGVIGSNHNGPYSAAEIAAGTDGSTNTGVVGRIVSSAVSVSYTGTELNKGGLLYCFASPDHHGLNGVSASYLGSRLETSIENTKRSKCWVGTYPLKKTETEYLISDTAGAVAPYYPFSSNEDTSYTTGDTSTIQNGVPVVVVIATGVVGNTFQVEAITHAEYVGFLADSKLTPSIADDAAYDLVSSAASRIPQMKVAHPGKTIGNYMMAGLMEVSKELKPLAMGAVKAALMAL